MVDFAPLRSLRVQQVQPFTYRDGITFLELLERLATHVKQVLEPSLKSVVDDLVEQFTTEMGEHRDSYVAGVEEFQRIHDAFMADVEGNVRVIHEGAVTSMVSDSSGQLGTVLRNIFAQKTDVATLISENSTDDRAYTDTKISEVSQSVSTSLDNMNHTITERSIVPQDYGAIADWDGTAGTDNAAAFQAAIDAAGDGGTVIVPAGEYYLGSTLYITNSITFTTGGGGDLVSGQHGTRLWFAPGITGIQVGEGGEATAKRPSHWKIGPLNIRSLSTEAGTGVGVLIRAGRGLMEQTNVESFGSHGVHLLAGSNYGKGNANLNTMIGVRAYGNYGDGIRLEGTDTNACLLLKPDVSANNGYGINLEASAMNKIVAPHADQQYRNSPGAFRDAGISNSWDWVYSEAASPFIIAGDSSFGMLTLSRYARPEIISEGFGHYSWRIDGLESSYQNQLKVSSLNGDSTWTMRPNRTATGSFEFQRGGYDGDIIWSVNPSLDYIQHSTHLYPQSNGSQNLGSNASRWGQVWANELRGNEIRVGDIRIRQSGAGLEISTNGTIWQRVVTE